MRNILVIGAGRSASSLIKYLLEKSEKEQLHITIADLSLEKQTSEPDTAEKIRLFHDFIAASQRGIAR